MRRVIMILTIAGTLAACGADGAPERPSDEPVARQPGITISGTAEIGIVGSR